MLVKGNTASLFSFSYGGRYKTSQKWCVCDIKEHEEMVPGHEQEEMVPGTLQSAFMYNTGQ